MGHMLPIQSSTRSIEEKRPIAAAAASGDAVDLLQLYLARSYS